MRHELTLASAPDPDIAMAAISSRDTPVPA
jgi:hypothetical protein